MQIANLDRAMLNVMLEMLSMLDRYPNSFKGSKASCLTLYLNLNQAGNEDGHWTGFCLILRKVMFLIFKQWAMEVWDSFNIPYGPWQTNLLSSEWPESESSFENANLTQCDKLKSDFEFLMFSAGFEALDTCYVIFEMCLQCSFDQQMLRTRAVMFWLFCGFLNEMWKWD